MSLPKQKILDLYAISKILFLTQKPFAIENNWVEHPRLMSLLRKHLVIRAHMEFRALFATKNSQFLPRNVSVYNQTPGRCTKRKEGWNFVVFVDLERLIVNYQREETCLFILLYKTCLIRNYTLAPKRKARIAGVWMSLNWDLQSGIKV